MVRLPTLWRCAALICLSSVACAAELELTVTDRDTGNPVPCRLHIKNAAGRPQRVKGMPFWSDHVAIPGVVTITLSKGKYTFEIERGPEYVDQSGYFVFDANSKDTNAVDLVRGANMAEEGWWSGDLHVHRAEKDLEAAMLADDLHVAPVVQWTVGKDAPVPAGDPIEFDKDRYRALAAGELLQPANDLLLFNLQTAPPVALPTGDVAASLALIKHAMEQPSAWIDVARPASWDVPVWLALGRVDSFCILDDEMLRSGGKEVPWGRPRDKKRYAGTDGAGRWAQDTYYQLLNAGFRIPPSAGSGSGEAANPIGYSRVYVWAGKEGFSYEAWWKAFRAGRVMVTNGPLIRPTADGKRPGEVFKLAKGQKHSFDLRMNLTTRDPISYVEVVKDGKVLHSLRMDEYAKKGQFPPIPFDAPGWFLVRAVTDVGKTYRAASSAPWYVEAADQPAKAGEPYLPAVHREAAEFFLAWTREHIKDLERDPKTLDAVKPLYDQTEAFWQHLAEQGPRP